MTSARVFLGMGSNLGDRFSRLEQAAELIAKLPDTEVVRLSSVYETEPWGRSGQPDFLNQVAEIRTGLSPAGLLEACRTIEQRLGRRRTCGRWGPRFIDIDILYFGTAVMDEENLRIPHPAVAGRRFVLEPLAEIAPGFTDPESGRTVAEMLKACVDGGAVRRVIRDG
ncbi:2-amino-4-hydroxy-6-hydroxymethyldihydropteridine diphosphokinase [bacterium]|nr:2-amino-4-hydroxy-6-hydroxymethyldihydropteridine diphosphokinase [bacterium]